MAESSTPTTPLSGVLASLLPRAKLVLQPFPFGLSDDDDLQVLSVNSAVGVKVVIDYRMLTKSGEVKAGQFFHVPHTDRTLASDIFKMSGGFVTNMSLFVTAGTPLIGQTFMIVTIVRGAANAGTTAGLMLAGPITQLQGLGWPGSPVVSSVEGEPALRTIIGSTPGAGLDIVESVPTGARWELMSARAALTLNAGGIAAPVRCTLDDGSNIWSQIYTPNAGGASTVSPVSFGEGVTASSAAVVGGVAVAGPIPNNRMRAGARFSIHSEVGAAAVQWSAPVYNVREWLEVG